MNALAWRAPLDSLFGSSGEAGHGLGLLGEAWPQQSLAGQVRAPAGNRGERTSLVGKVGQPSAGSREPPLGVLVFGPWQSVSERLKTAWARYLTDLERQGKLPPAQAGKVLQLWLRLVQVVGAGLPPPQAGPKDDGGFLMAWSLGNHYFEIELLEDGSHEWFYRERRSGDSRAQDSLRASEVVEQAAYYLLRMFPGECR